MSTWLQIPISLRPRPRGMHLVSDEIFAALATQRLPAIGFCQLFLQHTSASLCLGENADPTVRRDAFEFVQRLAPDGAAWMQHDAEGPDDMPAHLKCLLLGHELLIPIRDGRLALGTWQGIWLGEHRNHGGARQVLATISGA